MTFRRTRRGRRARRCSRKTWKMPSSPFSSPTRQIKPTIKFMSAMSTIIRLWNKGRNLAHPWTSTATLLTSLSATRKSLAAPDAAKSKYSLVYSILLPFQFRGFSETQIELCIPMLPPQIHRAFKLTIFLDFLRYRWYRLVISTVILLYCAIFPALYFLGPTYIPWLSKTEISYAAIMYYAVFNTLFLIGIGYCAVGCVAYPYSNSYFNNS